MTLNPSSSQTENVTAPAAYSRGNASRERSAWIDNLRTAVVILVVNMHCCVTYSYVGDWYIKDGPEGWLSEKMPYIFWQFHLQSFFMGLLFFIAGSFADGAIRRHGAGAFLRERLFRLGVPALLYMMIVHPLIVFGLLGARSSDADSSWITGYLQYLSKGWVLSGSGPMWFVLALLLFSGLLAAWRGLFDTAAPIEWSEAPPTRTLWMFALALALATALSRSVFPIGTNVLNFQLGYFPQYIVAFAVGVAAGRGGWLEALAASRRAQLAGGLALIGGPLCLGLLLLLGGGPAEGPRPGQHGPILYFGGWNLLAFGAAIWEQFTGVGLALGMMALSWRALNRDGPVSRWLAERSFAVYVLHAPILVSLTLLFRSIHVDQFTHIVLLTVSGVVLSFAIADIAKRMPWLKRVL